MNINIDLKEIIMALSFIVTLTIVIFHAGKLTEKVVNNKDKIIVNKEEIEKNRHNIGKIYDKLDDQAQTLSSVDTSVRNLYELVKKNGH